MSNNENIEIDNDSNSSSRSSPLDQESSDIEDLDIELNFGKKKDFKKFDRMLDDATDKKIRNETIEMKKEILDKFENNEMRIPEGSECSIQENVESVSRDSNENSEITTYEDIDPEDPLIARVENKENTNSDVEVVGKTKINGIETEIVIDRNNDTNEEFDEEELQQRVQKSVENKIKKIKNEAAAVIHDEEFDISEISPGTAKYNDYFQLLNIPLFIPQSCIDIEKRTTIKDIERKYISMDSFVQEIAKFPNYSWKRYPDETLLYNLTDVFVICKRMNSLFKHEFGSTSGTGFRFDTLTENTYSFLKKYSDLDDLIFEHQIIVMILGKLEVLLNTNTNIYLKSDKITVSDDIFQIFKHEINDMFVIQTNDKLHHISKSWNTFVDSLFNLRERKNYCFDIKKQGYENLNRFLENSYCYNCFDPKIGPRANYQMEELIGNTLKMYSNSIVQSFFFMIKTIYIMVRLISIYIQKFYKDQDKERTIKDIKNIAAFAVILYEHKYRLWKVAVRSTTKMKGGKEVSGETQIFIDNYVICGGQYYLLKFIEKAIPILAFSL